MKYLIPAPSDLSPQELSEVRRVFSSEEVVRKGVLTDVMCAQNAFRQEALDNAQVK